MNSKNMKSRLSNVLDNNKDIFIKRIGSMGAKVGRILLAILVFLQSFIGYIPMVVDAEDAEILIEDGKTLKSNLEDSQSSNKILKLNADITVDTQINLIEGNYTIDLNGHSITSNAVTIFNAAVPTNFTIKNTAGAVSTETESNFKSSGATHRVLNVSAGAENSKISIDNVKISGFTHAFGAINISGFTTIHDEPDLKITNSVFENNSATMGGQGVITIGKNDNILLQKNTFIGSEKQKNPLVYANGATVTIDGNTFKNNENIGSGKGGAVNLMNCNSTVSNNIFTGNKSSQYGGALYITGTSISNNNSTFYNTKIEGNTFENNQTTKYGGAVYISSMNNTFINNKVINNKTTNTDAYAYGGAIYSIGNYKDEYIGNTITGNQSLKGGAIFFMSKDFGPTDNYSRTLTLRGNHINNNKALNEISSICENNDALCGQGGALYISISEDSKHVENSLINIDIQSGEFNENEATDGGAIYFGEDYNGSNKLILKKALITNNKAPRGGGVWLCPKAITEMHSTLGGAIYNNQTTGDVNYYYGSNKAYNQTLRSAGDDIFYEGLEYVEAVSDRQYGPGTAANKNDRSSLKVISRTWSGKKVDWYKDEVNSRYKDGNHDLLDKDDPYLVGADKGGTKDLAALHGEKTGEENDALIVMNGNTATRRGGAIFTNNVIDLGLPEDIDVTVNKKFIKGTKEYEGKKLLPDAVYVNLYRIDSDGSEELIEENVELSEDNDWSHTFVDLPSRDENGDFRYTVRESDESLLVNKTVDNGENGICKTDKNCNITLTNRVETPVKYQIEVEKEISGDTPIVNSDFIFKLNALNPSEGMILPKNLTTKVFGKGKAKFDEITFVDEGVYVFNVSEENTNNKYYKYDDSVYTVAIEVVSNEDNKKLEIGNVKITKNNNSDTLYENVKFTNKYDAPDVPIRINPDTVDKIMKYVILFMLSILGTFAIVVREYCFKK